MAFVDRIVDYPNRFTLTDSNNNVTGPYTLTRDEGEVTTVGTLLNASNLNTEVPRFYLNTAAQAGTTDGDLYAALQSINWDADTVDSDTLITKELFTKLISAIAPLYSGVVHKTVSKSAADSTDTYFDDLYTASADGVFIGAITVTYQTTSTTGRRGCRVFIYENGTRTTTDMLDTREPVSGAYTATTVPVILELTSGQGITMRVWQNSGSAVTCVSTINGIFLSA